MAIIASWQGFAQRHPVPAFAALTILFTACALGEAALANIVYYSRPAPGELVGATIALYLAATFVVGLVTPLKVGCLSPMVAYSAVVLLWPLTPWDSYNNLTYESGWTGALLVQVATPSAVIWFVAYAGRKMGGPLEVSP